MSNIQISRFENFGGNDRLKFPDNYYRVTGGKGGEAVLFFIEHVAVLYDCGMAYCYESLLENIERVLASKGKTNIDYILLSHTHYDHIGALPYVLDRYPDATVCGSEKCKKVFASKNALNTMIDLGQIAMNNNHMDLDISNTKFRIDKVLSDGGKIQIGDTNIVSIATLGHTDCSMSYYVTKDQFLFTSESTGVLVNENFISTSILKDYQQTIDAAKKLMKMSAKIIYSPHYGIVPSIMNDTYFDKYIEEAGQVRDFIMERRQRGKSPDEILSDYVDKYYDSRFSLEHPEEAFRLNAKYIIKNMK